MPYRNWKIIAVLVFILLLAVFLAACTGEQAEDAGELVFRNCHELTCVF